MSDVSLAESAGEGDAIRVFVRVRPEETEEFVSTRVVEVNSERREVILQSSPPRVFTYDHVSEVITQEAIFSVVAKRLIESCLDGYNGTIFAYGQTGSGKTFTMLGPSEDADIFQHNLRGIIPRSFEHLFSLIGREYELHGERKQFLTKCSFLELYQESVYDLLDTTSTGLQVRESIKHGVYVDGLKEVTVTSPFEAYQVLRQGWMNRRIAATSMNRESSRSHAIFTLTVESKEEKGGIQNVRVSRMNLVDLAGSERQKDANTVDLRLKEAGSINKSLSVLGTVIRALVKKAKDKSQYVQYRNSRLTFLLRDSLGGNAKTHIVACVHPGSKCFGETLSTLQFAQRAKMIKNKAMINEDTLGNIQHLQSEIRRLKEQLLQFQSNPPAPLAGVGAAPSDTPSQEGVVSSSEEAQRYLKLFVEAMQQVERLEQHRKSSAERIQQLENLNSKSGKMLQSTRMIIKLRDDRISRLEKVVKEGHPELETDALVADLRAELVQVRHQQEHNPRELHLATECRQLRAQLSQLAPADRVDHSAQSLAVLEAALRQLQADTSKERRGSSVHTPKGPEASAAPNVEKYKTQISNLQNELKSLQSGQQEEREAAEKEKLELNADLTALRQTVKELECALKAHHLTARLDREGLNQTIRSMATPPQNARYQLRSRIIPGSPTGTLSPGAVQREEEGETVGAELPPPEMAEGISETLAEEVKQLQDTNAKLNDDLNELNADIIRLRQDNTKLQTQNEQLSEVLSKERSQWSETSSQKEKEKQELEDQLEETSANLKIRQEEIADLKVLLASSDKELKEARQTLLSQKSELEQRLALQDTKMFQLSSELETLREANCELQKENDQLQDAVETANETLKFRVHELEQELKKEEESRNQLRQEAEVLRSNLAAQEAQYVHMMDTAGKQQEQVTAELLEQKLELQQQLAVKEESAALLRQELEAARTSSAALEKTASESKVMVTTLCGEVQTLKQTLGEVRLEKEEAEQQVESMAARLRHQGETLAKLEGELTALIAQSQADKNSYEVNIALVKDDLDFMTDMNETLQRETERSKKQLEEEQAQVEALRAQLAKAAKDTEETSTRHQRALEELSTRLREAQNRIAPSESQAQELAQLLEDRTNELDTYRENQSKLQALLDDYEMFRQQNQEEIVHLKAKVKEMEMEGKEKMRMLNEELLREREAIRIQAAEERAKVEEEKLELSGRLQAIGRAVEQHLSEKQHASQQLDELKQTATIKEFQLQQQQQDVERLQELVQKHHTEIDALNSKLEEAAEEKAKMTKTLQEVTEHCNELAMENAKLVGHQNPKQKIQYHLHLKEENNSLKELLAEKVAELQKLKFAQRTVQSQNKGIRDRTNVPGSADKSLDSSPGKIFSPR